MICHLRLSTDRIDPMTETNLAVNLTVIDEFCGFAVRQGSSKFAKSHTGMIDD